MDKQSRWFAILAMCGVLIVLYLITPSTATSFALGVLLISLGWGFSNKKFSL